MRMFDEERDRMYTVVQKKIFREVTAVLIQM